MKQQRFVLLTHDDLFDLESVNPKENTTRAYNQFIGLYLNYCSSIGIAEEVLPTKPRDEVFETVRKFVACVRTKNGQFFSQSITGYWFPAQKSRKTGIPQCLNY